MASHSKFSNSFGLLRVWRRSFTSAEQRPHTIAIRPGQGSGPCGVHRSHEGAQALRRDQQTHDVQVPRTARFRLPASRRNSRGKRIASRSMPTTMSRGTQPTRSRTSSRSCRCSSLKGKSYMSGRCSVRHVGIREFKNQATSMVNSGETLVIERHGKPIGFFVPVVASIAWTCSYRASTALSKTKVAPVVRAIPTTGRSAWWRARWRWELRPGPTTATSLAARQPAVRGAYQTAIVGHLCSGY